MITVQFKLMPTLEQSKILCEASKEYINSVNDLVDYLIGQIDVKKLSTKSFIAKLPSSVKNEVANTALSVFKKNKKKKTKSISVLKKPVCTWNNQNYEISDDSINFPMIVDGKCQRIKVNAIIPKEIHEKLNLKKGSLRISKKNNKWIAQIAIKESVSVCDSKKIMGVDLGLKIPAVAVTENNKTKFFGNGRQNKQKRRHFKTKRKNLGKAKKQYAIKKLNNKEQRWMKDQDHKISRKIVGFAIQNNIGIIKLEQLANIRQTARTSRKNAKNLHTWSFYRLANFIEYKSNILGIKVEFVNPKYTSQICPKCGERNHADDRNYVCKKCGYHSHRDRVGALNIINAPVISGKRKSA
jgi:IS605 OrfB family transposase